MKRKHNIKKIDKLIIADEFLEQSIRNYFENFCYFSALHLAGAAQEIYGKWIRCTDDKNFGLHMLDFMQELSREQGFEFNRKEINKNLRRPKNSIKHFDNADDRYVTIDAEEEAFGAISEAIVDCLLLNRKKTKQIQKFVKYFEKHAEKKMKKFHNQSFNPDSSKLID